MNPDRKLDSLRHLLMPRFRTSLLASISLLLLLSAFCLPLTVSANSRWQKQKSGTLSWLRSVFFLDERRGWVVGGKGSLLATVDGGESWHVRPRPTEDTLRDIVFTSERDGWILCERSMYQLRTKDETRSYLLKTENGGENWSRVDIKFLDPDAVLARMAFADALHGWLMGEAGLVFATADGGRNWARQRVPTGRLLLGGHFLNSRYGWIAGAASTLLQTSDGGATWVEGKIAAGGPAAQLRVANSSSPSQSVRFNAVTFVDARRGWAVGSGGAVYSTSDGGSSWRAQDARVGVDLFDVKFLDAKEGYAVGAGGTVLRTSDGGEVWSVERTNTPHQLERLFFVGRTRGWAVGFGGTIVTLKG